MITYTFAQRFVPLVHAGVMQQTFEPPRLRHARVGEPIRLMDKINHRQIVEGAICTAVERMDIIWTGNRITGIREGNVPLLRLEGCAKRLGYADLEDMATDFARLHGPRYTEGYMIEWRIAATAALELEVA